MILKYGSYTHDDNEVTIAIEVENLRNERGRVWARRERWHIRGELLATGAAAITAKIAALKAAYSIDNRDLGFFTSAGAATAHGILTAQTMGGVRVVNPPNFPKGDKTEYFNCRTYEVVLEADFPNLTETLLLYVETISITGTGGPRRRLLETLDGPPVEQIVNARTTTKATQQGQAVGLLTWPAPPPPIWPAVENVDQRTFEAESPKRMNVALVEYPVKWRYVFESPVPLIGRPNVI